jgi:hypothetical protein
MLDAWSFENLGELGPERLGPSDSCLKRFRVRFDFLEMCQVPRNRCGQVLRFLNIVPLPTRPVQIDNSTHLLLPHTPGRFLPAVISVWKTSSFSAARARLSMRAWFDASCWRVGRRGVATGCAFGIVGMVLRCPVVEASMHWPRNLQQCALEYLD